MKVVVLGAGGYIGAACAAALSREGHIVTGVVRREEQRSPLEACEVTVLVHDVLADGVDAVLQGGVAAVIDCCGTKDFQALETIAAAIQASGAHYIYTAGTQGRVLFFLFLTSDFSKDVWTTGTILASSTKPLRVQQVAGLIFPANSSRAPATPPWCDPGFYTAGVSGASPARGSRRARRAPSSSRGTPSACTATATWPTSRRPSWRSWSRLDFWFGVGAEDAKPV